MSEINWKVKTPFDDEPLTQHTAETLAANIFAAYDNGYKAGVSKNQSTLDDLCRLMRKAVAQIGTNEYPVMAEIDAALANIK